MKLSVFHGLSLTWSILILLATPFVSPYLPEDFLRWVCFITIGASLGYIFYLIFKLYQ